jgi:type VI protein secretion system component Hcp
MALRHFSNHDGANGAINEFEDWFAAQGPDNRGETSSSAPTVDAAASDLFAGAAVSASGTLVPATSPLHYFLKIDGVTGDSTVKGFEGWFSVDGFDLGVTSSSSLSASGGGGGAGKASFSPLTVDIHSLAGLAPLFGDAVTGHVIKSVELVGAETLKGQSLNVYDVKLSDVRLTSFGDDPGTKGVETELGFSFGQISVTDRPPTANGAPGTPQTFSFDVLKNADALASDIVSGAAVSASSSAVLVPASSPLHYFLKIDGVTGDSTVKGFEGWFSVDGFDLGVTSSSSLSASGGGAGAGKASFSPLTVDIHSLAGLAPLFGDAVTGHVIKSVELVGAETLKGTSLNVYDVKLSDVQVTSFGDDPGTQGVETALAFNFGQISLTDRPPAANGAPGTPQTFNFDVIKNTDALAASDVVADASVSASSSAVLVPDSSPLHYFLKIDGVTGDSTVKGFEGWFSVDGFDLGVTTPASFSSGGGGGAGKASFSPLTVDIHSLAGLAPLFGDAVTGHVIKSVELVGAETLKGQNLDVYDVKLSDVQVTSFGDDPGTQGVETALGFSFGQISLTDRPPAANGAPGTPQTFNFDVLKNADALTASDVVADAGVSAPTSAVLVPDSSPLHYFLKIDGVTGDSTVKGFEGWFSVDGFDLGVTNPASFSSGGGGGAGKATFSPLTVDIHSLAGLAPLFGDAVTGHVIKAVELVGAETLKGQSLDVYDVKVSDVHITSFGDDPGTQGVETALAFDFGQISVTDRPPTANGAPGAPQTFSFDTLKNTTTAAVSSDIVADASVPAVQSAVLVPATSPLHYFLKIDGVTGDSTVKGFVGWFSVDGFDLGVTTPSSLSAGGGGGAGKPSFSPLTVDIHSLAGLAPLFGDAVTGHVIKAVELVGAETLKGQNLKLYDVKLSDVQVTSFGDDPGTQGVETSLACDFGQISLTDRPPTARGAPGAPQTFSFDTLKNTDALAASDVVSGAGVSAPTSATLVPATSPLQYFLKVDGVTGDSTVKGFAGWFSVDGFDLDVTTPSSLSAGGGGAGKPSFSPLTVDIHSLAGLAPLFGDAVTGHVLKSVELVGAETLKGQSLNVYDIKLSDVQVTSFGDDPGQKGVETALGFSFGQISLTTRPPTASGAPGTPQTVSFDLLKNATGLAASDLVFDPLLQGGALNPITLMAAAGIDTTGSQSLLPQPTLTAHS